MTTEKTIRVVIVDDHRLVRQGLEAVLASDQDVRLVGQAADGRGAVDVVAATGPDVVLMDLQLPELSGLEATREILAARPGTAVLVLTMFEDNVVEANPCSAGSCRSRAATCRTTRRPSSDEVLGNGPAALSPAGAPWRVDTRSLDTWALGHARFRAAHRKRCGERLTDRSLQ